MSRGVRDKGRLIAHQRRIETGLAPSPLVAHQPGPSPLRWFWISPFILASFLFPAWTAIESVLAFFLGLSLIPALSSRKRNGLALTLLGVGVSFLSVHWLTLNPYNFMAPGMVPVRLPVPMVLTVGFLCCFTAFLTGSEETPSGTGSQSSRITLSFILIFGAVLRLAHFREPHPTWGYDPYWEIIDLRNVVESGVHHLIFPLGGREPLFTYLLAPLWFLFPEASPYIIANAGSALIDLTGVWLLYLLGKELSGRRAGLICAALGAVSKPLIITSLAFTRGVSVTPVAAAVMLLTLRVFKRPDRGRLIQWALALGIAAYTYMGIRVLILWTGLSTAWILLARRDERPLRWPSVLLVIIVSGWFGSAFLVTHRMGGAWEGPTSWGWVGTFLAAMVAIGLGQILKGMRVGGVGPAIRHWAFGLFLACVWMAPLALHPLFAEHLSANSAFKEKSLPEAAEIFMRNLQGLWAVLFSGGADRPDMNIISDSFLDVLSIPAVLLGLCAFLARPRRDTTWILLAGLSGLLPWVMSVDSHTVRLLCAFPAMAALGAAALSRVWDWYRSLAPGRMAATVGTAFGVFLCLLGGLTVYGRVWGDFTKQADPNQLIPAAIRGEFPDHRVYFAQTGDFFLPHQQAVQFDGRSVHLLQEVNFIDLRPDEPLLPVVVFFCRGSNEYGDAWKVEEYLKDAYPDTPIQEVKIGYRRMGRLQVSPDRILGDPEGLFRVRRIVGVTWRRSFPSWTYGLGRGGFVQHEDLVGDPTDPLPQGWGAQGCRIEGTLNVPKEGTTVFEVKTGNVLGLDIDGRTVWVHRSPHRPQEPVPDGRISVPLAAGNHTIRVRLFLRGEGIPALKIKLPGWESARTWGRTT